MSAALPPPGGATARILVVDDDRRVRELLEIALSAHGFGVLMASDGDEAIKHALGHRPDLVVLDVRLPKKSGLEVCDALRRDPDDPTVPIILVSAAVETDARLQAFSHGADDYLSKPFSPKELVARIKRLLSRSAEARAAILKARELERQLLRSREECRRAHIESRREHGLRELVLGLGRDLLPLPDCEAIGQRLLLAVQAKLGIGVAGLLVREHPGGWLVPTAVRGDGFERIAGIELRCDGELAQLLAGLGRPVRCGELERIPEVRGEIGPLVSGRFGLLAPIKGPDGLEGLMVMDERVDGTDLSPDDREVLMGLCEIGAVAIQNSLRFRAQIDRMLELVSEDAPSSTGLDAFRAEVATLVVRAARATALPPRQRDLVLHGVSLGPWALGPDGLKALGRLRILDPTGRIEELQRMLDRATNREQVDDLAAPEERRAVALLSAALDYVEARGRGVGIEEALANSHDRYECELDGLTRRALADAAREGLVLEGDAV